jgi:hypothetical protein
MPFSNLITHTIDLASESVPRGSLAVDLFASAIGHATAYPGRNGTRAS